MEYVFIDSYSWQGWGDPKTIESPARYVRGRMQYAPTLTDKKLGGLLADDSQTGYILGRMQYAPTYTDKKLDTSLFIDSSAGYILGRMQYAPTHTDKNWVVSWLMIHKPGMFWDVCNTPLP